MSGQRESTTPSQTFPPDRLGRPQCPACSVRDCPAERQPENPVENPAENQAEGPLLAGWRLGLVSAGLFLGPVVLAILGAGILGSSPGRQLAGAIGGLGMGFAVSVGVTRMMCPGGEPAR